MKKHLFLAILLLFSLESCSDSNEGKQVLKFYSWNEYMDPTVIQDFEAKYHVKVQVDYFANNEEAIAKIEQQNQINHNPGYDVFMPSGYFVKYLKEKNLLEKIDITKMPHVNKNIFPYLIDKNDPKTEYSVPYDWGSVGILYNKDKIKEPVDSWKFILDPDPKYKNQIMMIDSPKELLGVSLKYLGYSFNSKNPQEIKKAGDLLKKQSQYVLNYNGDAIQENMANNEALMAVSWSAEAGYAMQKNPALDFVIPKEGSNLWVDSFVILKGSKNKDLAHKFIDFFYEDSIQKKNWDYMHMSVPSKSFFKTLPKEVQNDTRFYPSEKKIKTLERNQGLDSKTLALENDIYTQLRS